MLRQITIEQVALNLQAAVNEVKDRREQLIMTQGGEPVAALVSMDFLQRWLTEREKAFEFFKDLPTWNSPYSEEEVEADIEQAIREVHAEHKLK